ncbi:DUF1345 domain-containing protein [Xylophilus rhododendri]|uniref:DUF1345 domain-containing protein n=1 Tax=Xylophilus rhododendri TaxID=2697032 RepID=A0A857J2S2_9BURK|nr:DUF1345 domain-containing protein [Xylophilus rhododendri]QHI97165.1 DUF1345 domain-containing protein [Xylophilus rhododendri]
MHFSETTGPQRLAYAALAFIVVALLPLPIEWPARGLLAWIAAAAIDLGLAARLASGFDACRIRERAKAQDESAWVLFLVMVVALCASVAAIVLLIGHAKNLPPAQRVLQLLLSALALAASWLWIHSLFAFHYSHLYYQSEDEKAENAADSAGLDFPGPEDPEYFDFLYHALVIGMTSQVSDVQVTTGRMRRLTTVHALLAFVFNVVLLALGINALASAL